MPTLEILDPNEKLHEGSAFMVLSYAAYPSNEEARQQYFEAFLWEQLMTELEERESRGEEAVFSATSRDLALLLYSPPPEYSYRRGGEALQRGQVAGRFALVSVMARATYPDLRPSKEKIIEVLKKIHPAEDSGDFEPFPKERSIWKRWTEFKPVSHILAAFEVFYWGCDPYPATSEDLAEVLSGCLFNDLPGLLSYAESLRLQMESLGIVEPDELYSAPASLQLESTDGVLGPLPEEFAYLLL